MAQHDYVIANANGATVIADINNVLLAISSTNSGTSEPSTTYAYMLWLDSDNNLLKLRNAANDGWITLGLSITASNTVDINGGAIDGTPIGASSTSTGAFTTITASSTISGTSITASTSLLTPLIEYTDGDDAITIADGGGVTIADLTATTADINAGSIDNATVGSSTANTGAFTTLSASGATDLNSTLAISGNVSMDGSANELRFYEGANYVGFEAPALTGDQIWVLPTADGSADQVLKTDGSGNLGWATAGGGGASDIDDLSDCLVENNSVWLGNDPSSTTSTASYCVSVGTTSLDAITTGDDNTSMGYDALTSLNTGEDNTAFGYEAGKSLTIGVKNVFIGHGAGKDVDKESGDQGSFNTFIGQDAGALVTNSQRCTYVGRAAGGQMAQGPNYQTHIGMYAGSSQYGSYTTTVGYGNLQAASSGSYMVAVGANLTCTGESSILIGAGISDNTSDEVMLGDAASYYTLAYSGSGASWSHSSDERMKKDITTDTLGLSFINDLRPVTFNLKAPSEFPTEWNSYSPPTYTNSEGEVFEQQTTPSNTDLQHGLIAQEVKAALDTAGVSTFTGWSEREDGQQRIAKGMFILPLINAVKELSTKLEAAENRITALES